MICKKCGIKLDDDAKFCTVCGAKINEESTEDKRILELSKLVDAGIITAEEFEERKSKINQANEDVPNSEQTVKEKVIPEVKAETDTASKPANYFKSGQICGIVFTVIGALIAILSAASYAEFGADFYTEIYFMVMIASIGVGVLIMSIGLMGFFYFKSKEQRFD